MGLRHLHRLDCGVDMARYEPVSQAVALASGRGVSWHKSLVGGGVFTHESGIHVDGLIKDLHNYQGVDPAELGRAHQIVLGKHSGRSAIFNAFARLGIEIEALAAEFVLQRMRAFVEDTKRAPSDMELMLFLDEFTRPQEVAA